MEQESIDSLRRWLREKDDEIAALRAKVEQASRMLQDTRIELRRLREYYEPDPGNADVFDR